MRRVIFVCKKLPRIRSGHGVLVYNNVTQKATGKVVLDPSEYAMYLETCLEEAGFPVQIVDAGIKK